jgi:hypothetical protein
MVRAGPALALGVAVSVLTAGAPAAAAPPTPDFGAAIDGYAPHDPQTTCDPDDKPGAVYVVSDGLANKQFDYGSHGTYPVPGNWNGTTLATEPGIVANFESRVWRWYLKNSVSGGIADEYFDYGDDAALPVPLLTWPFSLSTLLGEVLQAGSSASHTSPKCARSGILGSPPLLQGA